VPSSTTKYTIRAAIAIITLFFDAYLIYLNLFFPLAWLFVNVDQTWKIPSNWLGNTVDFGMIALILFFDFFLFYRFRKMPKTFYLAPVFTVLFIGGLVISRATGEEAPNTTIDSTGNGYHYRTEIWFYEPNGTEKYKRWKSRDRYDGKTDVYELRYMVDSVWISK